MVAGLVDAKSGAIPLVPLDPAGLEAWLGSEPEATRRWVEASGFAAKDGEVLRVPGPDGAVARVLAGIDPEAGPWSWGGLPRKLGRGTYRIEPALPQESATRAAVGWALGCYVFARYREPKHGFAELVWPETADRAQAARTVEAHRLARDLINTPASDLGPAELAAAAEALAARHGARFRVTVGDDLLAQGYPTIHMVGRAAARAPRLADLVWGDERHPKLTLVGKGVCFDSGGLDLKPAAGMRNMKKDMGGAATVLALAHMVMDARLPVRLRVLVPAVENAVSGDAMRPLDVVRTRKGLTVEVGNTDAEGRLILCDALAEADSERPDLIIDCATLTGAARIAVGPDLPALFCNDDELAAALLAHGIAAHDPLCRLPLHRPYRKMLESDVADLNNVSEGPFAGAITAALFLEHFVAPATPWAHLDLFAWNQGDRPGRPKGGELQFARGAFEALRERFGG